MGSPILRIASAGFILIGSTLGALPASALGIGGGGAAVSVGTSATGTGSASGSVGNAINAGTDTNAGINVTTPDVKVITPNTNLNATAGTANGTSGNFNATGGGLSGNVTGVGDTGVNAVPPLRSDTQTNLRSDRARRGVDNASTRGRAKVVHTGRVVSENPRVIDAPTTTNATIGH